ncbi:MAG: pilus assembly protein PilP [Deltaproteobacteria bacterium]|nr:pilus assembly protein PilP [Deltaproteobacteria bacterium]
MTRASSARWASLASIVMALVISGCDDPVQVGDPVVPSGGGSGPAPAPAAATEVDAGAPDAAPRGDGYHDDDFVEVDVQSRDPFRDFVRSFAVRTSAAPQRRVLMPTTSVDEMSLIAIISGVPQPRAMLVDPAGVGHTVKRGDYIGRPEVIQTGGAEGIPAVLNWRVDRIRPSELVLTRSDPNAPDRPPLTRSIPLHEEGEAELQLHNGAAPPSSVQPSRPAN